MQKGFNTDLVVRGQNYHVQTEDWGTGHPFIVTTVFKNGSVIKTLKTPHQQAVLGRSLSSGIAIQQALEDQHQKILDAVLFEEIR